MNAATKLVERCWYVAGVLVKMSQMIAKRKLSSTLGHDDRRCFFLLVMGRLFEQARHGSLRLFAASKRHLVCAIHLARSEQAGIGPISQRPELSTTDKAMAADSIAQD